MILVGKRRWLEVIGCVKKNGAINENGPSYVIILIMASVVLRQLSEGRRDFKITKAAFVPRFCHLRTGFKGVFGRGGFEGCLLGPLQQHT